MDDRAADPWRPTRAELLEQAATLASAAGDDHLADLIRTWGGLSAEGRRAVTLELVDWIGETDGRRANDELDLEDVDRGGAL
ncbi:MAG: hypothetical protein AAFR54_07865 [Planctomycetota bacterium]